MWWYVYRLRAMGRSDWSHDDTDRGRVCLYVNISSAEQFYPRSYEKTRTGLVVECGISSTVEHKMEFNASLSRELI